MFAKGFAAKRLPGYAVNIDDVMPLRRGNSIDIFHGKIVLHKLIGGTSHVDSPRPGQGLKAVCNDHRFPENRVLHSLRRPQIARDHFARVDADAYVELPIRRQTAGELLLLFEHFQCTPNRPQAVVHTPNRSPENGEETIAQILVQGPFPPKKDLGHQGEIVREKIRDIPSVQSLAQERESLNVGEQYRYLEPIRLKGEFSSCRRILSDPARYIGETNRSRFLRLRISLYNFSLRAAFSSPDAT